MTQHLHSDTPFLCDLNSPYKPNAGIFYYLYSNKVSFIKQSKLVQSTESIPKDTHNFSTIQAKDKS